ncbi:hypothetical protein BU16DRAFT_558173 [Lophium mytilinum]|uniref:F-box domain-containing protein n=1 Tax=Lophium mytilinum TaxID=390894 RepID=A0A6A6R531_9PEZI|nr:hypothetical protein BU16DRAFT_558173 [Lophium mytilinum]
MAPFFPGNLLKPSKKESQPSDQAVVPAVGQVLHTPELAEMIFSELDNRSDILRYHEVCKQWRKIIDTQKPQLRDLTDREKESTDQFFQAEVNNPDEIRVGEILDCIYNSEKMAKYTIWAQWNIGIFMSLMFGPGLLRCGFSLLAYQLLHTTPKTWLSTFYSMLGFVELCNFIVVTLSPYRWVRLESSYRWNVALYSYVYFDWVYLQVILPPIQVVIHAHMWCHGKVSKQNEAKARNFTSLEVSGGALSLFRMVHNHTLWHA